MFYLILKSINRKIKHIFFFIFLFFSFISQNSVAQEKPSEQTLKKFQKMDDELWQYGGCISEWLLRCSYIQDTLLAFLYDAENVEEYHRGMEQIDDTTGRFRSICQYTTTVLNFYTGESRAPSPQEIDISFDGQNIVGFLNTFKTGKPLTQEERERYFNAEFSNYSSNHIVEPFILDASTINDLEEEIIYNFALLPDGTIRMSKERSGDPEYLVGSTENGEEAFLYPNHTILAGEANQPVVTAGSFVLYRSGDKRLFMISSKSGHFQPTYRSLNHMRIQLAKFGINPYTVVYAPDVDLSRVVLKIYESAQVPLLVTAQDAKRLFQLAEERWKKTYETIDRNLLKALAQGDFTGLDSDIILTLNQQREEGTYMRSAYHLFSANHEAPKIFHKLVKRFGKLKDAIKHHVPHRITLEAARLLEIMDQYEQEMQGEQFISADDVSFYEYISENLLKIKNLLSKEALLIDEYHDLKKSSRELGVLFMYMAQDVKGKSKGYFIYGTASDAFFQINELMGKTHDSYVAQMMNGNLDNEKDVYVELSSKIVGQLERCMRHLGIAPPKFMIEIKEKPAWWMINSAKDWYASDYYTVSEYCRTKRSTVREFLQAIIDGDTEKQTLDYDTDLLHLEWLLKDAKLARDAVIFLDISHQVPEMIHTYISKLKNLIDAVKKHEFDKVKEEAQFLLDRSYSAAFTKALQGWQCADQNSFNDTLSAYLHDLYDFQNETKISKSRAEEIVEHVKAFQNLMNLFRKNGKDLNDSLPEVCYDALETHADALIYEIQQSIELSDVVQEIIVTPKMILDASFILSRIDLGNSN